ncbi:MAG: hypothetical protein H7A53_05850 [Akkermansiaceae bacterium]|nr:hypothetical protein [Akkermansiaceae bacterium]
MISSAEVLLALDQGASFTRISRCGTSRLPPDEVEAFIDFDDIGGDPTDDLSFWPAFMMRTSSGTRSAATEVKDLPQGFDSDSGSTFSGHDRRSGHQVSSAIFDQG